MTQTEAARLFLRHAVEAIEGATAAWAHADASFDAQMLASNIRPWVEGIRPLIDQMEVK